MKKITLFIIAHFMFAGCASFPVVVTDDPFKGGSVITADMWHSVLDRGIDNTRVLYLKTITVGSVSDPTVKFEFVASDNSYYGDYHGEKIEPDAFILADSISFPVKIIDSFRDSRKVPVVSSFGFFYPFHRFHYFPLYHGVIIGSGSQYTLTAKIRLSPDICRAILSANKYMIRFYTGDTPLTLRATPRQLDSVKRFLLKGAPGADAP